MAAPLMFPLSVCLLSWHDRFRGYFAGSQTLVASAGDDGRICVIPQGAPESARQSDAFDPMHCHERVMRRHDLCRTAHLCGEAAGPDASQAGSLHQRLMLLTKGTVQWGMGRLCLLCIGLVNSHVQCKTSWDLGL